MDNKNNKKSAGYYIGTFLAIVLLSCLAACIGGIAVGLTVKFLTWIF